jgi:flagellar hook assembly protein FlgD
VEETPRSSSASIAAYPNPFNPATTIRYTVTERGRVRLKIYDASGEHVVTLLNEERPAGSHTVLWGGRDEKGVSVSSGVYFVSLEQNGSVATTKVTLLK